MKKYHIADILTLCEVIFTGILLYMVVFNVSVNYAIWVFIIGELCDAFDGICARRWHYPEDGKKRWWREYAPQIDQISDVLLASVCGLYLLLRIKSIATAVLVGTIAGICISIEVALRFGEESVLARCPHGRLGIILGRRYCYVAGIGIAIVLMIFATTWPEWCKKLAICLGVAAGIILVLVKRNRLTQDKTPIDKN